MTRPGATIVGVRAWYYPSSFTRSNRLVRRRRILLDDENSTLADPIAAQKEWSALQVSGVVLLVGTLISHFLLLYCARKFRKRPLLASKVRASVVSMSEKNGIDMDATYASRISSPIDAPQPFTNQCHAVYDGNNVNSSSSSASSSHSPDQDLSCNLFRDQQRTYTRLLSESASLFADSQRAPQLPDRSCSKDYGLRQLSASFSVASSSSHDSSIPESSALSSLQKVLMTDTPVTTNMTESGSSSSSYVSQQIEKLPRFPVETKCCVEEPLPFFTSSSSTSSSIEVKESNRIQYPNWAVNTNGTVCTLANSMENRLPILLEPQSLFVEGQRPISDIPCTVTTTKKRRHHRIPAGSKSLKEEEKNSLQVLFGKPLDEELIERRTMLVSVDDDEEEESVIKRYTDDVSKSPYRNHRQLLLIEMPFTEPDSASSSSAVIPMWVSSEEELMHHRVDEE